MTDVDPHTYRRITGVAARTFVLPGRPKPKERPRMGRGGHVFTPRRTVVAEAIVAAMAEPHFPVPLGGAVALELVVVWPMPAGWSGKKRRAELGRPVARRPDVDNLLKGVSDGLNGIAYCDDQQIADARVCRVWGEHARTLVCVQSLGPAA